MTGSCSPRFLMLKTCGTEGSVHRQLYTFVQWILVESFVESFLVCIVNFNSPFVSQIRSVFAPIVLRPITLV